jgi:hypothetical protein
VPVQKRNWHLEFLIFQPILLIKSKIENHPEPYFFEVEQTILDIS